MGAFFDNLHILKNDKYDSRMLTDELSNILKDKGYSLLPEGSEGDISLMLYEPANSKWVSIACEAFMFDTEETIRSYADPLSKALDTDVMAASCYDSDYLRLALLNVNDKTDGWINVGKSYDPLIRRTKIAPWKKLVNDTEKLKELVRDKYVLAEEALFTITDMIGMDSEQVMFDSDDPQIFSKGKITKLSLKAPEGEVPELPKLRLNSYYEPPCALGTNIGVSFYNEGGKSKGFGFMFVGDFVENDEITFEHVYLCLPGKKTKYIDIDLKKVNLENGKKCFIWEGKDIQIPPAVNQNLPIIQRVKQEMDRELSIRFTPVGNPDMVEDIRLVAYPLSNSYEGQASWFNKKGYN